MARIFPVVMAGGAGTRFWPLSRKARPKQLLDLCEPDVSMLAATVRRFKSVAAPEDTLIVTGEIIARDVAQAVPELPPESILAEPMGRNTAPCVGWAALHVRRRDPDGVMAVLPADHAIGNEPGFLDVVQRAAAASVAGAIATIGITPNRPETGYGYIELAEEVSAGVRKVARFVEKPDLETAKGYLSGGKHVWNSGTFFFTAKTILAEIERQMPELWAGLEEMDAGIERGEETKAVADVYGRIKGESIDYGIMEGADNIVCCPGDFGWNDVGSWAAAYEMREGSADSEGNIALADLIAVDAKGCLAWTDPRKQVALVGVEDLVVVDTEDALLICPRKMSQKVKDVVNELKARKRNDLL